ncbi:MAG: UUP1 family membrane protein [Pseudomonadota bacterium]
MKNSLRHAVGLALILLVTGLGLLFYKVTRLDYPVVPDARASLWDIEIYLEFSGRDEPARLNVFIPTNAPDRELRGEQFYNGPFGLTLLSDPDTNNRRAVWTYRYPNNRKVLRYAAQTNGESAATPLPVEFRESGESETPFEADTVKRQAFIVWVGDINRRSADDLSFAEFALAEIFGGPAAAQRGGSHTDEINALIGGGAGRRSLLELARQTLASQSIPVRVAHGVYLGEGRRRAEIEHWLEYHIDGKDYRYFPGADPQRFLTVWYGPGDLVQASGVGELDIQISLQSQSGSAEALARTSAMEESAIARYFSFGTLPLTTQLVYKVLITIPVGITILVFLRQFIGIKTLGTFMPVLIGIAFRETALVGGIILFTFLIALGLAARFYLERLQLLLVPRLAVVLIFIVILMAGITIVLADRNQAIGLSISLFPMVIITMTIERMSIIWEESSPVEAIKHGLGSLFVASVAFLAMSHPQVEYLMYNFPELLLVLMALCLLMGRYTGLRLSELWRFRQIARS